MFRNILLNNFFFIILSSTVAAQIDVTPLVLRIDSSFTSISINYSIDGDVNLNSELAISYRLKGTATFKPAAMSMRASPLIIVDGSPLNMNFHAGSILYLTPNTLYEINVELIDPDGGGLSTAIEVYTKNSPTIGSNNKYVSPGAGGGVGTQVNPYLGLQEAANNAQPGDHFIVSAGVYNSFNINASGTVNDPISFKSENLHLAIIDGNNINSGIVTLGVYNDSLAHILLDGFDIHDGRWGVDAQNTQFLTIQNCMITDVEYGVVNRRDNGWEHDQYFYNNTISGRTAWPGSGIPSERGIDIRGNNNVVSYNTINNFGDGISTDGPPYLKSYSLDIHNNDIKNIVDDIIEIDGSVSNTRVYQNRGFNGRMGVSLAPVFGGPCYVFRNQFFNIESSTFKLNRGPAGLIIVNNTSVKLENGISSDQGWQNTFLRNNVIVGSRYCFEEYGLVAGSTDDWNYDAFLSTRAGGPGTEWFKWDNFRYDDVPELQSSGLLEAQGIAVDFNDFEDISLPSAYSVSYDPSQRNLEPSVGSAVIDNGISMDNLIFSNDGLVDRGALEWNEDQPRYGADYSTSTCSDGINNGDEVYTDCGGSCVDCNDCPYDTLKIMDQPLPSSLNLKLTDWIEVNGIIAFDGNVTLKAGDHIELLNDFETALGADLLIDIENCVVAKGSQ